MGRYFIFCLSRNSVRTIVDRGAMAGPIHSQRAWARSLEQPVTVWVLCVGVLCGCSVFSSLARPHTEGDQMPCLICCSVPGSVSLLAMHFWNTEVNLKCATFGGNVAHLVLYVWDSVIHSVTDSLTHLLLTHPLLNHLLTTHSLTHSIARSLIHSQTYT